MSLAARRAARRLEDFLMRLGCFLVTAALLVSLVLEPPRAKAFAMTSGAITALAGGFLNACGLAPVVSGMGNSSDVNESLARLIQDYLDAEYPGVTDALSWIGDVVLTVNGNGKVIIPSAAAKKLSQFASWVASKYGTKPGVNQVYAFSGTYALLADGSKFVFSTFDNSSMEVLSAGTIITASTVPLIFASGAKIDFTPREEEPPLWLFGLYKPSGNYLLGGAGFREGYSFCVGTRLNGTLCYAYRSSTSSIWLLHGNDSFTLQTFLSEEAITADESLALDVAETLTIPDELAVGKDLALDVGATQTMGIQEILQDVLEKILAGDLTASVEAVDEAVKPVEPDPPAEELPDLDSLGLPALGAALTSRFPFSIPWDVYKGVKLLAAPAKAPYFEVDFMAPLSDRVGGWKGSTKIVLDFSEYEIIGQVSRWTSTIGFCLMLATGTKRLIWTA